jgi:2-polyprenyl-3-methyl-5-hydroxy-6-metoxy-1,4-benzoquinol methylase
MTLQQHRQNCCPLCDSGNTVEELRLDKYTILSCLDCTVQFSSPQPDDETLAAIYSADYFLSDRDGISSDEVSRLKRETAKLYVDQILSIRKSEPGEHLLEIGCGSGDFLVEARDRGYVVRGLEFSGHAVSVANARLGSEAVIQGDIETAGFRESAFDIIVFSDVLEHVRNPKSFLSSVYRSLRPGGLVFIVTPSTDSWSRALMGRNWMEYKIEHLFYFNRRSLKHILTLTRFEDVEFHRNAKVLSFEYVRAHFRRFRAPVWTSMVEGAGLVLPRRVASLKIKLAPSGIIATARKSG